jgi:ribonuclease E
MQTDIMPKKMLIDATHAEETRVVVVDGNKVEEFDFESQSKRQLAGNIYLAKVTRVEPSLQAAFVDYGGNRHGFLAFSEIHPDYYQIPVADRQALIAEERAYAESQRAEEEDEDRPKKSSSSSRGRSRSRAKPAEMANGDAVATADAADHASGDIKGMEILDLDDSDEGASPMELVAETPVETPAADDDLHDHDDGDHPHPDPAPEMRAADKDDTIETVADEDDTDDMRRTHKPRAKRYKIQEVIKVRQILLIQVVKEERGNKGAALTTYLSLAGRYCVLMPNTARGGGISRKITNAADRKKLKEIAGEIEVPDGAGLIIRTAGSQRTKAEIKRDYEYLQRLWEQIRELTLKSIAPAKIYEEGDLIKRSIRDLYSKEIDEVIVAGEGGYRTAKDFMKMIMPSHAKNVKYYAEQMPLFARFQVEGYLSGMFNPTVQLPSGGYIVIGVTEALVAIDVNSGRATKEGSIEQTALKTNLEASDEVARQLRLRDLAGLIVIDYIDMDERKNNAAVEKRFKDRLKTDRARIQVGRISGFGLLEMSRQRLRPGMLEATTQPCPHCHGTGLLRSDDNVALAILRQLEEEGVRGRSKEVLVKAPVGIANFLINAKRDHIAAIEARYGMSVRIECDPFMISPDFAVEKFKTATRVVPEAMPFVSNVALIEDDDIVQDDAEAEAEDEVEVTQAAPARSSQPAPAPEASDAEGQPKKKRRRRRRRRGGSGGESQNGEARNGEAQNGAAPQGDAQTESSDDAVPADGAVAAVTDATGPATANAAPKKRTRSRSRTAKPKDDAAETAVAEAVAGDAAEGTADAVAEKPKPKPRSTAKKPATKPAATPKANAGAEPTAEPAAKPKTTRSRAKPKVEKAVAEVAAEPAPTPEPTAAVAPVPAAAAKPAAKTAPKPAPEPVAAEANDAPKRKGWWSLGR